MNVCYLIARAGISGGTASLAYRLLSSLRESGYNGIYCCNINNDPCNMALFEREGIKVVCNKDKTFEEHLLSVIRQYDTFRIIVFSPEEYLKVEKLALRYSQIEGCLYYVVHDYAFCRPGSSYLFQLLSKFRYKAFVKRLYKSKSIAFMSKACLSNTCSLLGLELPGADSYIFNLPIRVKDWNENDIKRRKKHDPFAITTITRMDFPFKGYILGLISWFKKNAVKFNLRLTIIGDGPSSNELFNGLGGLEDEIHLRVTYTKNVPYDQLNTVFSCTDLYLGMGTTLIDAANSLALAIPVKAYTRELCVDGMFSDNIDLLIAEKGSGNFDELFLSVYNTTEEEYYNLIYHQYLSFKNAYDIKKMTQFILDSSYKKHIISRIHMFYMESINRLSYILHKGTN